MGQKFYVANAFTHCGTSFLADKHARHREVPLIRIPLVLRTKYTNLSLRLNGNIKLMFSVKTCKGSKGISFLVVGFICKFLHVSITI